jgi:hypothetical protein
LSNNWISLILAIVLFTYNLFSRFKKKNSFTMIIDDMKNNLDSTNKVGLEYKVKFIIYVLISIYSLCYAILSHFDDDDEIFQGVKIFG